MAHAYETATRAQEIPLLDVGDIDVANKRAMVMGKGGNAEPIGWETATAWLLPRYLAGRSDGPVFLLSMAPVPPRLPTAPTPSPAPAGPGCRTGGQLRCSARPAVAGHCTSWAQPAHALAEGSVAGPLLMAKSRHGSVKTLNLYAKAAFDAVAEVTAR
ncbi:MAG TPA: hypothetical protein VGR26_03995 [Acidimicrobiales bacterium]|nr:hypothetical protein [Acidimicrobiales bacterium]